MLKRLSSKAVASKEARRTLRYVEPLSEARTKLADFFSILAKCALRYRSKARYNACPGRRTQVVKGAVCKTAMQRFDPARRLHIALGAWFVWFIWSIWFVWFIELVWFNQVNKAKLNKPNNGLLTLAEGLPARVSVGLRS